MVPKDFPMTSSFPGYFLKIGKIPDLHAKKILKSMCNLEIKHLVHDCIHIIKLSQY